MCDSLKILLGNQGYQIRTSNGGEEAVEYLAKSDFDLVLLDIVMPDMSGHQIMDHINSQKPETLIIVMTGHVSIESAVESLRRGAYDYLRKPFDPEELLTKVENALNKKRLEKKLALAEKHYQYLVNNSPDIIYTLDHEGRFTFVNDAIGSLLGFKPDQLIGNHYASIVFEEDTGKARYHLNERRTGKRAAGSVELRLKCYENGDDRKPFERKHLSVEVKATGMYDRSVDSKDKEFRGTYGVGRDISARKQAEEALRDSEDMHRILVETMNDGLAVIDENTLFSYVNKAICQMVGYDPKELIGSPVSKLIDEVNARIFKEQFDRRKRGERDAYEVSLIHKDKKKVSAIISPQPMFDSENRFKGSLAVLTDITGRKLAEEQIQASLKEKEVLLKEVHHRVKNNLQIISSLLDLTRSRTENQEAIDVLGEARSKIHAMALIHTQLYQSDKFDRIDMQSHIRDMIIHLSQLYGKRKNINPVINASNLYLSVTRAIPCALVINELISNVYRHAFKEGEEGTVEVSMEQSSDGTISLKVKDDGIGIPEQVDINEADTLGLKLVRNLVLGQLRGKLQIERKDGTEILIEFRAAEEEVEHAQTNAR